MTARDLVFGCPIGDYGPYIQYHMSVSLLVEQAQNFANRKNMTHR